MNRLDLTDFLNDTMRYRLNSVSVWQDGAQLARHEAKATTLTNIHSGSKAFVSAAVGFAVREKLLSPDERVVDCFPESCPAQIPELLGELRLKHLLTMSMGFAHPLLMGGDNRKRLLRSEPDWTAFVLRQPIRDVPGSVFRYSNAGPYLLGVLIQQRSGENLIAYLRPRLLDPMEITIARWEICSRGYVFGSGGFYVDLDGFSKLGRLYLQRGEWNGRRLLPEDWVAVSSAEHIAAPGDEEIGRGYGYYFWTMPNGRFRADGKFEQYALVCPDKNAVVTIKADNQDAFADRPILRAALRDIVARL